MRDEDIRLIRDLIEGSRVLSVAVVVDGAPVAGLLPFAPEPDLDALLVHVSGLARHSRGLEPGAGFAALLHREPSATADPLQVPRVTLEGTVEVLEPGSEAWRRARARYLERLPTAEVAFTLADFRLCRLVVESGRLVAGFARTVSFGPEVLRRVAEAGRETNAATFDRPPREG